MSKKRPLSADQAAECRAAHRLYLERKNELNLSQKKIADEAGISAPAVNLYFKGVNALNVPFALVLSRMLRVPVKTFSPRLAAEIEGITEFNRRDKKLSDEIMTADGVSRVAEKPDFIVSEKGQSHYVEVKRCLDRLEPTAELEQLLRSVDGLTDKDLLMLADLAERMKKGEPLKQRKA